ncbi:tripartite tricarboxylate transporter substrate binding protein [Ideonella sp. TBM-1]|uniref:Tripartite tricarboxylate transporter substrate binding protein n=1 Tax=Ideonella livida TaxID=2707176 RepID=A0A7C9PJL7_9BURK|nr:tripartite tricarboxylate transporter substrate binding protein [Ideonella livida]
MALASGLALTATGLPAAAQAAPAADGPAAGKTVRLVVPFPPGGNVDLSARLLAPELGRELGLTVVVDNRAGAAGIVGLDSVAKAAPDGTTVGIASPVNHLAAPALHPRLPYDPVRDFSPVGLIASVPMVLVVGPSSPVRSVAELLARARQKPGALTMASAGSGSGNHIVGELFQDATGVQLVHVPYKGSSPANTDVAGGHVDLHFDQLSAVLPLLQAGRLRALAVTTARRSALLPEVPTLAEAGVPGFDASTTLGLVLPGRADAALVQRWHQALQAVLRRPAVREQFARLGAEPREGSTAAYAEFIRSEIARTARIVREAKITLD